jgi:hypothetical protein
MVVTRTLMPLPWLLVASAAPGPAGWAMAAAGQFLFWIPMLTYWHRPLHAMTAAFTEAGFRLSVISEPPFSPDTPRELLPPDFGNRTAFLTFIFFVLEAS